MHPWFRILSRLGFTLILAGGWPLLQADELDDTIRSLMKQRKVPGLSLAVVAHGKIVRAEAYGFVQAGGPSRVTTDTLFQAGSVSKPVAALAALRLVQANQLALDTDVNRSLRSWKVPDNSFTTKEKVTLRRLLNHTAGITVHGFPGYARTAELPTVIQILNGQKPANTPAIEVDLFPGSQWRYSGGGYTVMQQLVEDVTRQPYANFMRETVLQPLQMNASTFTQPLPLNLAERAATGHESGGKPVAGRWHVYPEMAAAGLWTTPSDLARFAIAVQDSLAGKPGAILSSETARLMVTRGLGGYGLGFSLSSNGATERFTHGGRDRGFDTQFTAYRETGQAAVVMININDDSSFMSQVMAAIGRHYRWPSYAPYAPPKPIEDREPAVTNLLQNVVKTLQHGEFARDEFSEAAAENLAATLRQPDFLEDFRTWGDLTAFTLVGRRTEGSSRHYRYHALFEHNSMILACSFDPAGKIIRFDFEPE